MDSYVDDKIRYTLQRDEAANKLSIATGNRAEVMGDMLRIVSVAAVCLYTGKCRHCSLS